HVVNAERESKSFEVRVLGLFSKPYLFYQFSVGQALDRDSKLSPKSGSVYEITAKVSGGE
ncbi:hypothetical protein QUA70_27270, partial [Microcoleus sp. LAD1_D5]|uniref:hypothetical protein n=1 Tax=unclassified Microcoleus TaxID=2642155 RepID=UPI002FD4D993